MNRWKVVGAVVGGVLGIAAFILAIVCGQPWGWFSLLPSVAATLIIIIRWLNAQLDSLIVESATHREAGS